MLKNGELGTQGKLAAPAAEKAKEVWDKYDDFKLRLFSR